MRSAKNTTSITVMQSHSQIKVYTPNWTEEIFIANQMQPTNPVTLKDLNGEEIQGNFFEPEFIYMNKRYSASIESSGETTRRDRL